VPAKHVFRALITDTLNSNVASCWSKPRTPVTKRAPEWCATREAASAGGTASDAPLPAKTIVSETADVGEAVPASTRLVRRLG